MRAFALIAVVLLALPAQAASTHACRASSAAGAAFSRAMLFFTTETPQNRALCHFEDGSVEQLTVGQRCQTAAVDLYADGQANGQPAGYHECQAAGRGPSRCHITCEVSP